MALTKPIQTCGIKGCHKPGLWQPVLLLGHNGPAKYANPARVTLKENLGQRDERALRVCEEHMQLSIEAYMSALDWNSLKSIMNRVGCPGAEPNTIGLQFERIDEHKRELIIPSRWPFLKNKTVLDGGEIHHGAKAN
jgi:hypothetical protein